MQFFQWSRTKRYGWSFWIIISKFIIIKKKIYESTSKTFLWLFIIYLKIYLLGLLCHYFLENFVLFQSIKVTYQSYTMINMKNWNDVYSSIVEIAQIRIEVEISTVMKDRETRIVLGIICRPTNIYPCHNLLNHYQTMV